MLLSLDLRVVGLTSVEVYVVDCKDCYCFVWVGTFSWLEIAVFGGFYVLIDSV